MLGVPVIATNWSGNLLFMTAETSALVPYRRVPVPAQSAHYGIRGAEWADPDIDVAADWLRRLEADRALGREIAGKARRHIEMICGEAAVGKIAAHYLKEPPSPASG